MIRLEMAEDVLFIMNAGLFYAFFKTKSFSFAITVIPITLACLLRYWIYIINKKQNDCFSFLDFLIITFRIFLIIQILNIGFKMNGEIEWGWSEVFWVFWVFFSIISGLILGLFMMAISKICQICTGNVEKFEGNFKQNKICQLQNHCLFIQYVFLYILSKGNIMDVLFSFRSSSKYLFIYNRINKQIRIQEFKQIIKISDLKYLFIYKEQLNISFFMNFGIGISQFVLTLWLNSSIKQFIKQIITEDEQDQQQIHINSNSQQNNNHNRNRNSNSNSDSILPNGGPNSLIIRQGQQARRNQIRQNEINLQERRNYNQQQKALEIPQKEFKKTQVNILPKFLIKFSNTYFKQYSESKMQSQQNTQRKSIKVELQQKGSIKDIIQSNQNQIENIQPEQINSSSRKKYDAVAAESLATQYNQLQKNNEVITLQNEEKIIVFDTEESKSKHSASQSQRDDNKDISFNENIIESTYFESSQNRKLFGMTNGDVEIKLPSSMKFIDFTQIERVRSELNSTRKEQSQKQEREDISECSTDKGDSNSQRQQIPYFKKQECNIYLKSVSNTFREINYSTKDQDEVIENTLKSIQTIDPETQGQEKITLKLQNVQIQNKSDWQSSDIQSENDEDIISLDCSTFKDDIPAKQEIQNLQAADQQKTFKNSNISNLEEQIQKNKNEEKEKEKEIIISNNKNNKINQITKQPSNELEKEEEAHCLICFENSQDSIFMDCGHGGICYECALDIWKVTGECYLCREKIKQILQIDLEYKNNKMVKISFITDLVDGHIAQKQQPQSINLQNQ